MKRSLSLTFLLRSRFMKTLEMRDAALRKLHHQQDVPSVETKNNAKIRATV